MTTTICTAQRRDGTPCETLALPSGYCFAHDPDLLARRKELSGRGGRHRSNTARVRKWLPDDLAHLQDKLLELFAEVEGGDVPPGRAQALCAIAGRLIDVWKLGYELVAFSEVKERLAEMERDLREVQLPYGRRG